MFRSVSPHKIPWKTPTNEALVWKISHTLSKMVDFRNTFKLYGGVEYGGAFGLQNSELCPVIRILKKILNFSRTIIFASVCQLRPFSSPYLYNSHLIQTSVMSPVVISLLKNITIDHSFCISQHFNELCRKISIQIILCFHCSESRAISFVWKVMD
jgi:hypothetical protein